MLCGCYIAGIFLPSLSACPHCGQPHGCQWSYPCQCFFCNFLFSCSFPLSNSKHLREITWSLGLGRLELQTGYGLDWEDYTYKLDMDEGGLSLGDALRIPWLLYCLGFLTSTPKSWRLCCANCQYPRQAMLLIKILAWQWQSQCRWATLG